MTGGGERMQQEWVKSDKIHNGLNGFSGGNGDKDIWDVDCSAHPMLDPRFPERPSRLLRFIEMTYERIAGDDDMYCQEVRRLLYPPDRRGSRRKGCKQDLRAFSEYLGEADVYVCSTRRLLPGESRQHVQLTPVIAECHDLRDLLRIFFETPDRRVRYEAQRKLALAQLLLDIDHSRHIQEGPRHKAYFEELLQEALWRHTRQVHELVVGYHIGEDGDSVRYTSRPGKNDQLWRFQSIFLEKPHGDRTVAVDVLYYNCRFKRTVQPISFEIVDGQRRVLERVRWGEMRQQSSGSILSKMIRRGINNPDEISDLVGAMFIVHDVEALGDLLMLLDASIGNPFGWRNVTDTLASDGDRFRLNPHSGRGYRVFKGDVDILTENAVPELPPYRFTVEIQIHTLESYLRTVCGSHEASHLAMKLRQFLYGLVPRIFPRAIYGDSWLRLE
jgi:hypothetical protein